MITSQDNATLKLVRKLLDARKHRGETGLFAAEGEPTPVGGGDEVPAAEAVTDADTQEAAAAAAEKTGDAE